MPTERQFLVLDFIIKDYIKKGKPISSQQLIETEFVNLSSATIRNDMSILEKDGYIEKSYKSAGRIPTNKGYKYYLLNIKENPNSMKDIQKKLKDILSNRSKNIDDTLSKALKLISEATNTLTITKKEDFDLRLEDLKLYKINTNFSMLLIVLSNGEVKTKDINLVDISYKELEIIVNIFSERLIGTFMKEIQDKAKMLKEIVSENLNDIENKFQDIVKIIFGNLMSNNEMHYGTNHLVRDSRIEISEIEKILEIVEKNTIWQILDKNKKIEKGNVSISLDLENFNNISIINKNIQDKNNKRTFTLVGSKQQDYEKALTLLNILEEQIKE